MWIISDWTARDGCFLFSKGNGSHLTNLLFVRLSGKHLGVPRPSFHSLFVNTTVGVWIKICPPPSGIMYLLHTESTLYGVFVNIVKEMTIVAARVLSLAIPMISYCSAETIEKTPHV
jgi:hypothetical protein